MTTAPFHPDHLAPGGAVGPWHILEVLGAGGFGRAFKVERQDHPGQSYTLKMALRPAGPHAPEEEDVEGRMGREVAVHMAYATDLHVHAMDRWPSPQGFFYFVTDFVDGEPFHAWRWRVAPSAVRLLEVFTELVRRVARLHERGLCHRDLKSDNVLIRKEDELPCILDYGTVRLPGMTTLTVGVPPAAPHLLPPESVAFLSEGTWQEGAHFDAGVPGDLYALGMLLYEALTDGHAFDPKLSYDTLLPAIATVRPHAPHLVNRKVPRSLSDIALRLLEKRPEDRFPSAEALLQALWEAAKERKQPEWQGSAERPPPEEPVAERPRDVTASAPRAVRPEEPPQGAVVASARFLKRGWKWWGCAAALGGVGLFLALWLARSTLGPHPDKGSPPMSTSSTHSTASDGSSPIRLVAAWVCATMSLACSSVPVIPEPAGCPPEAVQAMYEVLQIGWGGGYSVIIDVRQPGTIQDSGTYQDGPVVGRVVDGGYGTDPRLPFGTLLRGRLWAGEGIKSSEGQPSAIVRYTEAELPDGRHLPVCFELDFASIGDGRVPWEEGSKAGAVVLPRQLSIFPVRRWH